MEPKEQLSKWQEMARAIVPVPGDVIESVFLPPRGYLKGRRLGKGNILRIIDIEGQQVPDVIFFDANNLKDMSSCVHTRLFHQRWKIGKGDTIYSKYCRPMAKIVEDTVGLHYWGGGSCSAELNAARYGIEGTHTCRSNLAASMAGFGLRDEDIELDSILNLFMDLTFDPDGGFIIRPAPSNAGDYIDICAEMDIIVAISNCPQELNACNAWKPTAMRVVFYRPKE